MRSQVREKGCWVLLGSRELERSGSREIGMSDRHTEIGGGMLDFGSLEPDYCREVSAGYTNFD